jgi:uncharacterized zinc-type alcohol dehydrogenase-like protein
VGAGENVAIIGIGGLGHLGVKIADAMGMLVTALSRTKNPESIIQLGAMEVLNSCDSKVLKENKERFDAVITTVPHINHDLDIKFQKLVRNKGRFV